jgi:thiol:disulfide interchange protein DsbC
MITKILIVVSVLAFSNSAFASDNFAAVRESLLKAFPKAPVNGIKPTPINDLYEIESGDNIFYYCPKSENIILGEIYTKEGRDLTAESRNAIIEKKAASIDTSKAIKLGSGRNIVIEFTDPDCPFCRKSYDYWKTKNDITHYVFLTPVPSLHPKATEKSEWILSQKDKVAAFNDVFSGRFDNSSPPGITNEGKNLLREHLQIAAKVHVNGTPMFFVNNKFIPGANFTAIDQTLSAGPATKKQPKD